LSDVVIIVAARSAANFDFFSLQPFLAPAGASHLSEYSIKDRPRFAEEGDHGKGEAQTYNGVWAGAQRGPGAAPGGGSGASPQSCKLGSLGASPPPPKLNNSSTLFTRYVFKATCTNDI